MSKPSPEQLADERNYQQDQALEQLLADVRRMADGVEGILELGVRLVPNTPPAAAMSRLHVTPLDVKAMREVMEATEKTAERFVSVPRSWISALLKVIDDPRWVV